MSVYIKGMEMPKNCGECHFCHTEGFESWCCPTGREDILFDAIPEWCPLIGVPEPHGRLIDADALADDLETDGKEFGDEMKLNCASWLRSNATLTVIERSDYE